MQAREAPTRASCSSYLLFSLLLHICQCDSPSVRILDIFSLCIRLFVCYSLQKKYVLNSGSVRCGQEHVCLEHLCKVVLFMTAKKLAWWSNHYAQRLESPKEHLLTQT